MADLEQRTWEIINPSDAYTIVGDFQTCAVAVLILGQGHYGMEPADGQDGPSVPIFLLGGFPEWWQETFPGEDFKSVIKGRAQEIAEAMRTVLIGDRAAFEVSGVPWEEWHDQHRSSLNDIGARARSLAAYYEGVAGG